MTPSPISTLTPGGEFSNRGEETAYRVQLLPDFRRQLRLVFLCAALLNALFFLSDWRFFGQPHFAVAAVSRSAIVLLSLFCFARIDALRTPDRLEKACLAWGFPVVAASAGLVRPHTELSMFAICMLPVVFYLALPISFRGRVALGLSCSAATLGSFIAGSPRSDINPGLILSLATINTVLVLAQVRINRLQRQAWSAARKAEEASATLQTLLQAVPAPLVVTALEDGRLLEANAAARAHAAPLAVDAAPRETEVRLRLPDSTHREAMLVTAQAVVGGLRALLTIVIDITQRKEMEVHLRRIAATDPLTGLANRSSFFNRSAAEIRRAERHGHPLAVAMLDLDHFKQINDTEGHEAGDAALKAFADLCRATVREQDLVARIGGEEFALLLSETRAADALPVAERLREAVAGLRRAGAARRMTVSIGISEWWPQETNLEAALKRADRALYEAKQSGRNRTRICHADPALAPEEAPI
ncbi:MAG TPA: GGDEF domain-containing protein [Holophaga sp.]|nr:GGDEF domain-containing protein [Holophaga sp.]